MFPWIRPTLFESAEKDKRNGGSAQEAIGADERITDMTEVIKGLTYMHEVDDKLEKLEKAHKFDDDANKDLENHERRGVEAGFDYKERRALGIPPKNEKDSPTSRYSMNNIEEGLLARETANGVEYGIYWDKNGELISIAKGEKGSVMCYVPRDKDGNPMTRDSTFTHSHPSDINLGDPSTTRELGLSFSKGDITNHGANERKETRAVAREGTYSIRGNTGSIPKDELDKLKNSSNVNTRNFAYLYEKETDSWARNRMAAKILALKMDSASDDLIHGYGRAYGHDMMKDGRWFSSARFATLMAVEHRALARKFGYEYEFKGRDGFKQMENIVMGRIPKGSEATELAKQPSRPEIVLQGKFHPPTGISPVDKNGDTIRTKPVAPPPPLVTARGYKIGEPVDVKAPTKNQTRQNSPAQTPPPATITTPTKATPKAPRVVKPKKPTDIKPPKPVKTPAVKAPPSIGVVARPTPATMPFSGGGITNLSGGGGFGGGVSGLGGSIFGR